MSDQISYGMASGVLTVGMPQAQVTCRPSHTHTRTEGPQRFVGVQGCDSTLAGESGRGRASCLCLYKHLRS